MRETDLRDEVTLRAALSVAAIRAELLRAESTAAATASTQEAGQ